MITGGCGLIGANLVSYILNRTSAKITVLDNLSKGNKGSIEGLDAELIVGDVRNKDVVDQVTEGKDTVIHLAAQTSVIDSIEDPFKDACVNIEGSLNLLQASVRHGVQRFVFASSAAPLGEQAPPMHEDMVPRPISPYGASKLSVEAYCSAFYGSFDLRTVCLRFSNVYGPGSLNKESVVALFFKRMLEGKPLIIYGDGNQTRDLIYVNDICKAIYVAFDLEDGGPDKHFGEVYQVGTGIETSINQLADMIKRLVERTTDRKVDIRYVPERKGEIKRNYSRVDKFKKVTGFEPEYSLEKGLENTWEFFGTVFK